MNKKELNYILLLFFASLLLRIAISPLYIYPPDIPHDFTHYIKSATTGFSDYGIIYGPMFVALMKTWLLIAGDNYILLKLPAILLDSLSIILLFLIVNLLKGFETAKWASFIFAFSYITISLSAIEGDDDTYYIFFSLLAIYLLFYNLKLSAIFLGTAMSFKILPIIFFFLPIAYYIYQKKSLKSSLCYSLISLLTLSLFYLPFYLQYGNAVFNPLTLSSSWTPFGFAPLVALNLILNFLTLPDITQSLSIENPIITSIASPFLQLGAFLALIYTIKFKLPNPELTLFRNIILIISTVLLFSKFSYDSTLLSLIPILIIFYSWYHKTNETDILLYSGAYIIFISAIFYSLIYRWRIDYTDLDKFILFTTLILSFIGTYLMTEKISFSLLVLSFSSFRIMHADILTLLGLNYRYAWGLWQLFIVALFTISILLILYEVHKKCKLKPC